MKLAENIKPLVNPQPTLREDSPSPMVDQEKIQRYDGSAKALEAHTPGNYRHNEGVLVLGLPCSYYSRNLYLTLDSIIETIFREV